MGICSMGNSKWGLCNKLEGWVEEGDGKEVRERETWVYLWLILVDVWQETTQFCKAIILQLKYFFKKERINQICIKDTEKAMAPHSSTLAWKISWMEEPGRLQSMGSRSRTQLSYFTFTFHFHALEKEMATHSSVLAWRIPGTGEPSRLLFMGSHRVGHDWSDLAAAAAAISKASSFQSILLRYLINIFCS